MPETMKIQNCTSAHYIYCHNLELCVNVGLQHTAVKSYQRHQRLTTFLQHLRSHGLCRLNPLTPPVSELD